MIYLKFTCREILCSSFVIHHPEWWGVQKKVAQCTWSFLMIWSTIGGLIRLGVGSTILLVLQSLSFMSRAIILDSRSFASASDVVLDTIPDRETKVNHYHLSQLRLFFLIFIFYWWYRCKTDEVLILDCGLHSVSNGQQNIFLNTTYGKEDQDIFGTILKIYVIKASIGCRMLLITTICLGCTACTIIYKFLKSIKIYLLQLIHLFNLLILKYNMWMYRVWMIYFWMVKNHYPDRVMR
jgi:hypothetical protein